MLSGHNHSYTRANLGTSALTGLPKAEARTLVGGEQQVETVVVVSISGAMSGNMTMEHFGKMKQNSARHLLFRDWQPTPRLIKRYRLMVTGWNIAHS